MFWILFMPFPSCISQTIRENRAEKYTGSAVLCNSVMDVWTGFENTRCFGICMENTSSLCYLSQTSCMLLLKRCLLGRFVFLFVLLGFSPVPGPNSLISVQNNVSTSFMVQRDAFSLFFVSSLAKNVGSLLLLLMPRFQQHSSLSVEQNCLFFKSLSSLSTPCLFFPPVVWCH